jgi:16S rRNA (uracil1498-N3)-methyltransferase
MHIPRIYQNRPLVADQHIELDKATSNHLIKVLRLEVGADLVVFNGLGGEYSAQISTISRNQCDVLVQEFIDIERESSCFIRLFQGICRTDAMAYCIEKAVELGVSEIVPLVNQRVKSGQQGSNFWQKKHQHWQRIIIAACQQCGRNRIPRMQFPCSLAEALTRHQADLNLTLALNTTNKLDFSRPIPQSINLVAGPEAGLTTAELDLLTKAGYQTWSLGPRTLRSETAGLAAIAILQSYWGDLST